MMTKSGNTKLKIRRPSPMQFILAGILLWLAVSGIVLYLNRGFYFAGYEDTYVLDLPESDAGQAKFADLSKGQYVAELDRDHHAIYFQNIPATEMTRIYSDLQSATDTAATTLTETSVVHTDYFFIRVGMLMILSSILFAASMYYFVIRNLKGRQFKVWKLLVTLYVSLAIGVFAQLGLLSLVSRIYNLSNVSLSTLAIAVMWGILIVYFVIYDFAVKHNGEATLAEGINMNYRHVGGMNRVVWAFLAMVLVVVTFGLGSKFIIEAILIFTAIFFSGAFLQYFPLVIYRLNRRAIRSIWQGFQVQDMPNLVEGEVLSGEQLALKPAKVKKPAAKKRSRRQ